MRIPVSLLLALVALVQSSTAQKPDSSAVIRLAKTPTAPAFIQALEASFTPEQLTKGEAALTFGPDALFAIRSAEAPRLVLDDATTVAMTKAGAYFIATAKLAPYTSHTWHFLLASGRFGGRLDLAVYGPEAYTQPNVPEGKLSQQFTSQSKLYEGMSSNYWVYTPAQYDAKVAAPIMIWQDGEKYANREANNRLLITLDNLVHTRKIPAAIHIFISPGMVGTTRMRSVLYDTYTDKYSRYVLEEILPEVAKQWNMRADAYSRAIAGESSGAICAFNAAWWRPESFGRVYSRIGSYTSIQWKPGELEGGNVFPFAVRKQPKRNIRVFLSDGSEDLENAHGSWPLQNIQMANSLKMREYDFTFRWGSGPHSTAQGNAEVPIALPWLWRGYDASKTQQEFEMDPAEKSKPYFRVKSLNRD